MRVLVCGGRAYKDSARVTAVLCKLHDNGQPIDVVIEGGAKGADAGGRWWAEMRGIPVETYEADWENFGTMAGPMRNRVMLTQGRPDLVIAFPGGRGTADMVKKARNAGVQVVEIAT